MAQILPVETVSDAIGLEQCTSVDSEIIKFVLRFMSRPAEERKIFLALAEKHSIELEDESIKNVALKFIRDLCEAADDAAMHESEARVKVIITPGLSIEFVKLPGNVVLASPDYVASVIEGNQKPAGKRGVILAGHAADLIFFGDGLHFEH